MDRFDCSAQCSNRSPGSARRPKTAGFSGMCVLATLGLGSMVAVVSLAGCTTDEVGRTKTTTKETIDSPTQKSTVTETKTKETTFTPR